MNAKIYTGDIQPNAKEYKIWIDSKGSIKTYNTIQGTWSEVKGGGASNTQPAPAEKITFIVIDNAGTETTYTAEKGMTWKQFGESQYNVDAWIITPEGSTDDCVYIDYNDEGWSGESNVLTYLPPNSGVYVGLYENAVNVNDFIIANHRYGKEYDSWGVGGGGGVE